jgi:hypothetical protein
MMPLIQNVDFSCKTGGKKKQRSRQIKKDLGAKKKKKNNLVAGTKAFVRKKWIHEVDGNQLTTFSITEGIEIMTNVNHFFQCLKGCHGMHLKVLSSHHLKEANTQSPLL